MLIVLFKLSCRKADVTEGEQVKEDLAYQFFNAHKSADSLTQKLTDYFFRLHKKTGLANQLASQYGLPYWNKTLLYKTQPSGVSGRRTTENADLVAYIPLVQNGDSMVKSQLTVTAIGTDTTYEILTAGQYRSVGFLPNDTAQLNALKVFSLFANHDKNIFGHSRFKILDNRIFQGQTGIAIDSNKQYVIELQSTTGIESGRNMVLAAPSLPHSSCLLVYDFQQAGYTVNYYQIGEVCVITSYGIEGGFNNPNPGSGGGGSGSGSGGNNTPPCPGTPVARMMLPEGCGPGWQPSGGGGSSATPPDPCVTAQNAAKKMDTVYSQSKADSMLATIPNLATETKEKGFAIIKKLRINPYDMTDTTISKYYCYSPISTGTDSNIVISYSTGVLEYTAATLHTHPPKGYAAHSAKDIYDFLEGRIGEETHFLGTFVAAANGSQYALTITNASQASAFLATKSQNLNGAKWNEDSEIGKAFKKAYEYFEDKYEGNPNQIHLAYEMAMAAVLNQFGTGFTLNKKDAAGNFKPLVVKTSPDPRKPKKTIYTQECL
jgi:hypothetical protein